MSRFNFRYYPQPISPEMVELEKKIFRYSLVFPVLFLVIIWLVKLSETVLGISFSQFGMHPRNADGLIGILASPLIHGDWKHLIGNSSSFMVLSTALFFFYRDMAYRIFVLNYFLAGILLWLGGRDVWHIGASGIIYGLASFLLFSGVFRRDLRLLTISLIVVFLYGSFFWGLFPIEDHVSWDGHLMGALSGTILALVFYQHGPPRQKYEWEDEDDDDEDNEDENSTPDNYVKTETEIPVFTPQNIDITKLN